MKKHFVFTKLFIVFIFSFLPILLFAGRGEGRGHDKHGSGLGRGHEEHGNGLGKGHDKNEAVPIDGGLGLLIAAGIGVGVKKAYDQKKKSFDSIEK